MTKIGFSTMEQTTSFWQKKSCYALVLAFLIGMSTFPLKTSAKVTPDELDRVALAALCGTTVGGALLYGAYHLYNHYSLERACTHLHDSKFQVKALLSDFEKLHTLVKNDDVIIERYAFNEGMYIDLRKEYTDVCNAMKHIIDNVQRVTDKVSKDVQRWHTYEKASLFTSNGYHWLADMSPLLENMKRICSFVFSRVPMLEMIFLLQQEEKMPYYSFLNIEHFDVSAERVIRSHYAHSGWPLRSAWKDLEKRINEYQSVINDMAKIVPQVNVIEKWFKIGSEHFNRLRIVQRGIAGYSTYTQELLVEKEFMLKEEKIKQEMLLAQAEAKKALAQEQQAQAQIKQAHLLQKQLENSKRDQLLQCKKELADLKISCANCHDYYECCAMREKSALLKQRALDLASDLHDNFLWWSIFLNY